MKKVLFIANHKGFSKFNAPYFDWFKSQGWVVDNASPGIEVGNVDHQYDVDIQRSPFSLKNIKAYKELKYIIDKGNYDIIHVHTPMGAALGRLASISARKNGSKVIYTAHGFHFFKGAPLKNWLIFYPVELLLSTYTDALVTINNEDYERSLKLHLAHNNVFHIDGVGVNLNRFKPLSVQERIAIRKSLAINDSDFVILYIAQFIKRKNHSFIIKCIPDIVKRIPNAKFVFAGAGETYETSKYLASQLGVGQYTMFLGGRSDIPNLCGMADVHLSASTQEGLAIGNIEAMACGCSLVLSNIRGHKEVCISGRNGDLFNLNSSSELVECLVKISSNKEKQASYFRNNIDDVKKFSIDIAINKMAKIYTSLILRNE
jgi:glycosyltransferase EpsD